VALNPGTRIGSYEITSQLGVGGMGEVYRATDTNLKRQVALKVLPDALAADAERLARFQREAEVLASLNHPGIAALYGLERAPSTGPGQATQTALVMELVEGPTLADRIVQGSIPVDEALAIARQIAEALEAAHEQGIVHRDLKPANVKVRPDGTVKVLDFGLAKATEPASALGASSGQDPSLSPTITTPAMTQAGIILGTAAYMSPEQARGKPVDRRADVWAFGCVLFEMLARRRPFEGETATEILGAIIHKDPEWAALPASTPGHVRRLLRRCLEKDPKRRMRDMGDVALELDEAPDDATPAVSSARRAWWPAAVALVAVLVSVVTVAVTWRTASTAPAQNWTGERLGGPPAAYGPVASPDGTQVAFVGLDNSSVGQVWVLQPGVSGGARQLTREQDRGTVSALAWGDNQRIFYYRLGAVAPTIWSVSTAGEQEPRLVLENASDPRPLPDGSLLAVRNNEEDQPQLIRFTPGSDTPERFPVILSNAIIGQAIRVLPGGREAVVVGRHAGAARDETHLHVVDLSTGEMRRLAPDVAALQLVWSFPLAVHDGEVYFDLPEGDLHQIVAASLDGSPGLRPVRSLTSRPLYIDVAVDGSLYVDQIDQPQEVVRVDPATGATERFALAVGFASVLPLPNDRFLLGSDQSDQDRLMVLTPGGALVPFLDADKEARGPLVRVGEGFVGFTTGPVNTPQLGMATLDGRLTRELPIEGRGRVSGLAASPDGGTLYYAIDGSVYRLPVTGGASELVTPGSEVGVDPATGDLIVLLEGAEPTLVRVPVTRGTATPIPLTSDAWGLAGSGEAANNLTGQSVTADGRLLVRVRASNWFWPVGVLDVRAGGRLASLQDPPVEDLYSAVWDSAGRAVMLGAPFRSDLWRFRPAPAP